MTSTHDADEPAHRQLSQKVGEHTRIYLRGSTWQATWQEKGRQRRKSLKTQVKKSALRKALEIDRRLSAGDFSSPGKTATIQAAIDAYLESVAAERRRESTLRVYRQILHTVLAVAKAMRRQLISEVDLPFVDRFRIDQKACGEVTMHTKLTIVRQMVKFAVTRKMVAADPLAGLRLKKPKPTKQPCFDEDQLGLILKNSPPEFYPVFLILAETGLRIGEACWLTWQDIDLANNELHVRAKDGWKPKSGDERSVPLTSTLRAYFASAPRNGRWVLTASHEGSGSSQPRESIRFRALSVPKGVLVSLGLRGKLHTFRHTFISRCLLSGVEEAVVRSWVGHVDERILRIYTHVASKQSQERIKKLEAPTPPALKVNVPPTPAG